MRASRDGMQGSGIQVFLEKGRGGYSSGPGTMSQAWPARRRRCGKAITPPPDASFRSKSLRGATVGVETVTLSQHRASPVAPRPPRPATHQAAMTHAFSLPRRGRVVAQRPGGEGWALHAANLSPCRPHPVFAALRRPSRDGGGRFSLRPVLTVPPASVDTWTRAGTAAICAVAAAGVRRARRGPVRPVVSRANVQPDCRAA